METRSLEAASKYINNLLLARGLLRNGKQINFANPGDDGEESDGTMAQIINLVNDLVIRRDREVEHRENLGNTIRDLRATESQQADSIEKLKAKNAELRRSVAMAEAQQRVTKENLTSAETTVRRLKEQVQKLKSLVQQVRAQCSNDVRKRDMELQKLKTHLNERQRGKRDGLGTTTININRTTDNQNKPEPDVNNPGYSLKQETTEFLTQLCQNLSDENDTLINLSRTTIQILRELQGLSTEANGEASTANMTQSSAQASAVNSIPTNVIDLSAEMDVVLEHLRNLLTNPSFVPLEEVEIRDEEISRLREGWEKMEVRWKQAVQMMDGWHKRILDGGESIDIDDLQKGMSLDSGLGRSVAENLASGNIDSGDEQEWNHHEDEPQGLEAEHNEQDADEPQTKLLKPTLAKPPIRALGERHSNRKTRASNRTVSFHEGGMQVDQNPSGDKDETIQIKAHAAEAVTRRSTRRQQSQVPQKSKLSIQEKLAVVEAEAKEAATLIEPRKRNRDILESASRQARTKNRRRSTLTNDEMDQLLGVSKR